MGNKRRRAGSRNARSRGRARGEAPPATSSRWRCVLRLLAWPLLAVVAAFALYAGSLDHPLVYDDLRTIVENPSIHPPFDVRRILIYERFRPLVNLGYAADVALQGDEPASFHRTNLALHALATTLVFFLVAGAVRDAAERGGEAGGGLPARSVAGVVALIFAVHPLQTESVTYASARSEVLCASFLFAGLLTMRAWMRTGRRTAFGASFLLFLLASGSKEVGAMLPFLALAWDRLLGPEEGAARRWWRVHLPWSVLVGLGGLWRLRGYLLEEAGPLPRPVGIHLMTELEVIWRYMRLMVWPTDQSIIQPVRTASGLLDPGALAAGTGLALLVALAWRWRRRRPLEVLGLAWWLLLLAPSSSVVPLIELMAEHRVYAASAGFVLLLVALLARALDSRPGPVLPIVGLVVAGILGIATDRRLEVWETPLALWEDAAREAPRNWRAVFGHGDALRQAGDCEAAIPVFERARQLDPKDRGTAGNLGICYAETGRHEEAQEVFLRLVEADPTYVQGLNNLGRLATIRGDYEAALASFERSLEIDPDNVVARLNLIRIHEGILPNPAEALRLCREVRKIAPQVPGMDECIDRNRRLMRELGID